MVSNGLGGNITADHCQCVLAYLLLVRKYENGRFSGRKTVVSAAEVVVSAAEMVVSAVETAVAATAETVVSTAEMVVSVHGRNGRFGG